MKMKMKANLGLSRFFAGKRKERLLSRLGHTEFGHSNESSNNEDASLFTKIDAWWNNFRLFLVNAYQMGLSDPRQFIFASKSGLAYAIVSVLIFFKEPFSYISQYSIWAILTVVTVFEFSVGATLSKGFNHAVGAFCGGTLSITVAQLSIWAGKWQEVVIVVSIFIAGTIATYIRLYPSMKQFENVFRFFALIFCVVLLSGTSDFDHTVISRVMLSGVGACVCFVVTVCVYPIWAGENLHKLVVTNFRGVATSLEGCVNDYIMHFGYERIPSKILVYQASDDPLYSGYRSAVESSSVEDNLLMFAVWEPPHGRYKMLRYPWSHYVKVSGALRHCAFMVMAMHGCILAEIQAPAELRNMFKNEIHKVGTEGARILRELANKVEKMEKLNPDIDLLEKVHEAAEELQMLIDEKSIHLVNSQKPEPRRQPREYHDDPDIYQEEEIKPNLFKTLERNASKILERNASKILERNLSKSLSAQSSFAHWESSEDVIKNPMQWPSRLSVLGDMVVNVREVKTYESASTLSLANFTSSLIEFVARLQNLVNEFEELSEKAKFSVTVGPLETKETAGVWTRVLRCIGIKD